MRVNSQRQFSLCAIALALALVSPTAESQLAYGRPDPGAGMHGGGGRDFDGAPGGEWSPEAKAWHKERDSDWAERERRRESDRRSDERDEPDRPIRQEPTTDTKSPAEKTQEIIEIVGEPIARALGKYPEDPAERAEEAALGRTVAAAAITSTAPLSKPMQFLSGMVTPSPPTSIPEAGGWWISKKLVPEPEQKKEKRPMTDGQYAPGNEPGVKIELDPITGKKTFKLDIDPKVGPYARGLSEQVEVLQALDSLSGSLRDL